jgi:hypothetical protein
VPKNWKSLQGVPIVKNIKVGDAVVIEAGYNGDYYEEFRGYVREIEADEMPIKLHLEDEMYLLRKGNICKKYNGISLKSLLTDIMPAGTIINCPDIRVGKFEIINASAFTALNQIKESYGLYSRYNATKKELNVHLRDVTKITATTVHSVAINPYDQTQITVKNNDLRYKSKEDFKLTVEVSAKSSDGKKISVIEGSRESDANKITFNYAGVHSTQDLQKIAKSLYDKRCYDGFTGSLTTFGVVRTHAGDVIEISDNENPDNFGRYFIEKVTIYYSESTGFERKNEISYKFS